MCLTEYNETGNHGDAERKDRREYRLPDIKNLTVSTIKTRNPLNANEKTAVEILLISTAVFYLRIRLYPLHPGYFS